MFTKLSRRTPWIAGIAATILATFGLAVPAEAGSRSPQVLALVSLDRPMEFLCFNRECFVELSAFCLQKNYATPDKGTKYALHGGEGIRITGHTRSGQKISLDPSKHFELKALRTHVAVRMAMSTSQFHKLGLEKITVSVAENVSLVPAPSDAFEPQEPETIAVATNSWREIGTRVVDRDAEQMSAARVTNQIANALPPFTHVGKQTQQSAWQKMERSGAMEGMTPEAVRLLKDAYQTCVDTTSSGGMLTMRGCVSNMHDKFLGDLNQKYWDTLSGAS